MSAAHHFELSPTSMVPLASLQKPIDPKRWKTTPFGMTEESINPMALAIAWDVSFVGRGFSYKPNPLAELLAKAIQHKGFALIDVFSPCPTFNQDQTDDFYKEHTFDVSQDHDPTDRVKAFELALRQDDYPLGIIYRHDGKHSMQDELLNLRSDPPLNQSTDIAKLFAKHAV